MDLQLANQSPGVALSMYIKCWHQSTAKLELLIPQEHDCKLAHTSITASVEAQKHKYDAISLFEEGKLTHLEQ
eukprot:13568972-Ditylum_brightwellii.AAC.1